MNRLAQRRRGAENLTGMRENDIGTQVIEVAINVHRELGPGLLETVYEVILARELYNRGLRVERQVSVPIIYKGIRFEEFGWENSHEGGSVEVVSVNVAHVGIVASLRAFFSGWEVD